MNATARKIPIADQFERLAADLALGWGIAIFPCNPLTKAPLIGGRGGFKLATSDYSKLSAWTEKYGNAIAGLPTGEKAGFWVLDIDAKPDPKTGETGFQTLAALERKYGQLPDTFRVKTGNGGRHIYFKMPKGVRIPQRARDIGPGIDTRGSTGYVIAPGSVLSNGGVYEALRGKSFDDIVEAPEWLLYLAVFNARRRQQLAENGINGPDDLRTKIWSWEDEVRERLKLYRPKLQGELTEGRADELRQYVSRGITDEIESIRDLHEGQRDTEINNSAMKIWSLLRGAAELGVKTDDLEERFYSEFHEAVSALGHEYESDSYIDDKWQRACADADPRELKDKGRADPADEFADVTAALSIGRRLLEYPRDVTAEGMAERDANSLVKNLIYPRDQGMIYGESGTLKSFISHDLAWHLALGREWHGRPVKRVPVLYVVLEGVDGFRKRIVAYKDRYGDPGDWYARLDVSVSLDASKAGAEGVRLILEAAKQLSEGAGQPVGLIVIDTLARAIAGEGENEAEAIMGYLQKRVGIITEATGAAVLTVHHENKQGGVRGSTALYAGLDFVLHATGSNLINQKTKDDATGPLFAYELEPVVIAETANGEMITSGVLKTRTAAPNSQQTKKAAKPKKPLKHQATLLAAWDEILQAGQFERGAVPGTDQPGKRCSILAIREAFNRHFATGQDDPEKAAAARRQAWGRAVNDLPAGFSIVIDAEGVEVFWAGDDLFGDEA